MAKDSSIFKIDEDQLDVELLRQAELYYDHAKQAADARREWAQAKVDLELCEAELTLEIQKHPERFKLEKTTVALVEATIKAHTDYQHHSDKVINSKHLVDTLEAATQALDQKKRSLENLVTLWSQGYFGEPRPKGGAREVVEEVVKKSTRKPLNK